MTGALEGDRPGVLVTLCDLPFFPGKMGVDFFNLRELARHFHVGVVGPRYDVLPAAGVENLERSVGSCYFWPRALPGLAPDPRPGTDRPPSRQLQALPRSLKRWLLGRLIGAERGDHDHLLKTAILANLAPYLLRALEERRWQAQVVIQSDIRAWLDYLPPHLPVAAYFHDVRSDYLERRAAFESDRAVFRRAARRAERQEREIAGQADAVGFVSALDRSRAEVRLGPLPHAQVCEIPLDLDYYANERARLSGDRGDTRPDGQGSPVLDPGAQSEGTHAHGRESEDSWSPRVLFTGLLAHPPNRDAVLFFLRDVWPQVRLHCPTARFEVVGAFPPQDLVEACRAASGVELHADVPDIRPFFGRATVYVVPMRFGGGVRQKILEAWAMGVPVVLTRMAGEGSGTEDGANCLIADDAAGLARRVIELVRRPRVALPLLEAGRRRVMERHALDVAAPQFEQLVKSAIARRRARPLRVVFDATGLPSEQPGTAALVRRLLRALPQLDPHERYGVLASRATLETLGLQVTDGLRLLATDDWSQRTRPWRAALANRLARALGTHVPFGAALLRLRALHRLDADVVQRFEGAPAGDLDLLPQVRTLLRTAGTWGLSDQGEAHERRACTRALAVVCGSVALRDEVLERWQLDPARVFVVEAAADAHEQARHLRAIYQALHAGALV